MSFLLRNKVLRNEVQPAAGCTLETCSVSKSPYGYLPSEPLNIVFMAVFALSLIVHVIQGIRHRAWTFLLALAFGTLTEAVGYSGRVLLHKDPFNHGYLAINIICLTVAPAFIAAGIYLTLKHLVIILGTKYSRFAPKWYTRVFITCDVISFIVQTGGASLSSSTKVQLANAANPIMEAGIIFQVITLLIFGALALELYIHYKRDLSTSSSTPKSTRNEIPFPSPTSQPTLQSYDKGLKRAVLAVVVAYFAILIRCIYRIAEMAGGLRNPVMRNEAAFVVFDGVMCVAACVMLNVFHPGEMFGKSKARLA